MRLSDYDQFGGKHWETASLKHLLAHAGVKAPHTNAPLSEAMVLGIAGGIVPGYSFCPSVVDYAGGIFINGRTRLYATSPEYAETFLTRIDATAEIRETGGVKAALGNVKTALADGKPAMVYCNKVLMPYLQMPLAHGAHTWMHTAVVHGLDETNDEVHVADLASTSLTISLEELANARKQVQSYKNRSLTLSAWKPLTQKKLKEAVLSGVRDYVCESNEPRMKTWSLAGLERWAKLLTNDKNQQGWLRVYANGKLYQALRDVFESIETLGTGGGLYRHLYADFLDEAAAITNKGEFSKAATHYRHIGNGWTELAEAALSSRVAAFKKTKEHLRDRSNALIQKGNKGLPQVQDAAKQLSALEKQVLKNGFPFNEENTLELLNDLSQRIKELIVMEREALSALAKTV